MERGNWERKWTGLANARSAAPDGGRMGGGRPSKRLERAAFSPGNGT
jgi:hypothetical protein